MKKRMKLLSLFLIFSFILNFTFVYANDNVSLEENIQIDPYELIQHRATGAVITISVVVILWIIIGVKLLKPDPKDKAIKVNMADCYKELSMEELEKFEIDSKKFKMMVYQKFKDIHDALTSYDYDKLKINLTDDLYKSYVGELKKLQKKKHKNIIKDFEFVKFKIYNINNLYGLLHVDVYLNVRMLDYVIDVDTGNIVDGNNNEKMDFEFELNLVKKIDDVENKKFVISRKICINRMEINKDK